MKYIDLNNLNLAHNTKNILLPMATVIILFMVSGLKTLSGKPVKLQSSFN